MATVPLAAFCFAGHAIWPKADRSVVAARAAWYADFLCGQLFIDKSGGEMFADGK